MIKKYEKTFFKIFFVINLFSIKVFHVRSVTQGDVIRADAKEIPRIFQLLYAGEGESRKPVDNSSANITGSGSDLNSLRTTGLSEDKPNTIVHKGHEFVQISYHMPTTCEVCTKTLWNMFRPPAALECKRKFQHIFKY